MIPRNVALTTPRISQIYYIGIERMASQVTIDTSWLDPLLRSGHSNGSEDAAAAASELFCSSIGPSPPVESASSPSDRQHSPLSPSGDASSPQQTGSSQPGPSRRSGVSSSKAATGNPPRRRIRPKIALDPSQPLTAQGKPRARVYVACEQW